MYCCTKKRQFSAEKNHCRALISKKWRNSVSILRKQYPLTRGAARITVLWVFNTKKPIESRTSVRPSVCEQR